MVYERERKRRIGHRGSVSDFTYVKVIPYEQRFFHRRSRDDIHAEQEYADDRHGDDREEDRFDPLHRLFIAFRTLFECPVAAPNPAVEVFGDVVIVDERQADQQPQITRPHDENQQVDDRYGTELHPFVAPDLFDLVHVGRFNVIWPQRSGVSCPSLGPHQVLHRIDALFTPQELCGEHGSQGESPATFGRVRHRDRIDIGFVSDRVRAGYDAPADCCDFQLFGDGRGAAHPFPFAAEVAEDTFSQRYGRAARRIFFLGVVRLFDRHVVFAETVHQFSEIAVDLKKDVHADAVIRGIEKSALFRFAELFDFGQFVEPCRRAAYDGHARFDAFDDVAVGGLRSGEFDGDIDVSEVIGVEVCRIVNVDNQGNSVAARDKDLFDLLAHLAVAHESDLHRI